MILDVINKDNFNYIGADAHLTGGVSWAMVFRWDWMTKVEYETLDHTKGIKSPTIAGGLFSIGEWLKLVYRYFNGHVKLKNGSMNLENMMIKWIFGEEKISNFHLEFGNVAVKWKFYLVLE